jgi:hypothetical protein
LRVAVKCNAALLSAIGYRAQPASLDVVGTECQVVNAAVVLKIVNEIGNARLGGTSDN